MHSDEVNSIGNWARLVICIFIIINMLNEAACLNPHCDITIAVSGILLLWLGTFRIWK